MVDSLLLCNIYGYIHLAIIKFDQFGCFWRKCLGVVVAQMASSSGSSLCENFDILQYLLLLKIFTSNWDKLLTIKRVPI